MPTPFGGLRTLKSIQDAIRAYANQAETSGYLPEEIPELEYLKQLVGSKNASIGASADVGSALGQFSSLLGEDVGLGEFARDMGKFGGDRPAGSRLTVQGALAPYSVESSYRGLFGEGSSDQDLPDATSEFLGGNGMGGMSTMASQGAKASVLSDVANQLGYLPGEIPEDLQEALGIDAYGDPVGGGADGRVMTRDRLKNLAQMAGQFSEINGQFNTPEAVERRMGVTARPGGPYTPGYQADIEAIRNAIAQSTGYRYPTNY